MDWFRELQRAQQIEVADWLPDRAAWLRDLDGVYLYGTIGSEAILLADGSVRLWVAEQWPASEDYTERAATKQERIAALVLGAERHPVLRELLPRRPLGATACPGCGGSSYMPGTKVICPRCSGLGWLSPAT